MELLSSASLTFGLHLFAQVIVFRSRLFGWLLVYQVLVRSAAKSCLKGLQLKSGKQMMHSLFRQNFDAWGLRWSSVLLGCWNLSRHRSERHSI